MLNTVNKSKKITLSFLLVSGICHTVYAEQNSTQKKQTYVVQSFNSDKVLPIIQPMLTSGGSVKSYQNRLIIYTTPANYIQVRKLLAQIDKAPEQLTISLRVKEKQNSEAEHLAGSLIIGADDEKIKIGGGINYQNNQQSLQANNTYHIKTLTGYSASIDNGTLVGFGSQYWGVQVVPVSQGLKVKPMLLPDGKVQLTIYQEYNRSLPMYGIKTQHSQTQVVLPLGEWQDIAGVVQQKTSSSANGYTHEFVRLPLQIKVEK